MNNPPGQQGPAPLSSYFQDAQPGEPSLAPLTPIDNTLANIGKLDKDLPENAGETAAPCKLFADVSNFSVQDNSFPEQQVQYVTSAQLKPLAQVLPDPSTFFDTIGSKVIQSSDTFNPPIPDSFSTPLEIPLDKITPPDNQSTGSEGDRRRDAWIPTDETKKILIQAQTSSAGSFFPERDVLTMPGVVLESDLGDELYDIVAHYLGEEEAVQRGSLGCEHVTQDDRGLRELIQAGCFRAAINLTTRLLTNYGQGVRRAGHPSKHSPRSLQLWFTRLALLTKINSHSLCELEAEAFGMLQNPDLYFQFYPETYPNRTGSMASFSFRLLLAELPMYVNKPEIAIARLHTMLAVIRKMIKNLRASKCEVGTDKQITPQDRQESLKLWSGREARLQFSIVNCALQMKDYILATQIIEGMAASPVWGAAHTRALQSALGRICLQAGHISGAETYFKKATDIRMTLSSTQDVRELVDQSLLSVAQNSFSDAYQCLVKANQLEPANIMVLNNMAVCLLYSGKLKEAISVMENAVNSNPSRGLSESLLLNLCTLYELESSNTMTKKLALLQQLCRYKSDTVTNVTTCLKLHM